MLSSSQPTWKSDSKSEEIKIDTTRAIWGGNRNVLKLACGDSGTIL